jgi:predicted acetyltransferase
MIIWISGPYGVGKSTIAEAISAKLDNALIFDAEEVGNAVRGNYPDCPYGYIFEDYPLWGEFCCKLLKDVHEKFHKNIIVPMTLLREESYSIISNLQQDGIDTKLIILEASYDTVHDRILARGEKKGCWCMENIELARTGTAKLPGIHVPTDGKTVDESCDFVLDQVGFKEMSADLELVEADDIYADEISAYRQEFIVCNDHMDGCGSLRKYDNPHDYIENCRQRASESASEEIGGHAQQFFCIRKSDNHLIGMIQYRYEADPKFQIGYSVRPCDRGHGYAKWMLKQLLVWLKKSGLSEAPIACEPSNVASEHVILSCGGELVETCNYKGIDLQVYSLKL